MATIVLYANKINQMPEFVQSLKRTVVDYKSELFALKNKSLKINQSICDLDDVVKMIQASTDTQEQTITSLDSFRQSNEQFIEDVVHIDNAVSDIINQRKKFFYEEYYYLKPECEKNGREIFCDDLKSVKEWCKEHWKILVTVVLVVVAVTVVVCTAGAALGPIATILVGAAKGLIIGTITGGIMGGMSSMLSGKSFFDGFIDGAFTGALSGALFGGLGGAGQVFGKFFGASCKIINAIKCISIVSGSLSFGMAGFDLLAVGIGLVFGQDNPFTVANIKLHSNKIYNVFQFGISAIAVFSGSAYRTMKPMPKACFAAGTMILAATGFIAIEEIKAGQKVISTNPRTFETSEKIVLKTFIRKASQLVHLVVNGEAFITTMEHPFFVKDIGFVNSGELRVEDKLLDFNGNIITVEDIKYENTDKLTAVYNFQVEDFHTYYIGKSCVLVHNNCEPMGKNRGNTPKGNQAQNRQFRDVAKKLGLNKEQQRQLHNLISHQGLGYQELLQFAKELFDK